MKCDRCKSQIEDGDEREYAGQVLCEDCYMDALSPVKACDPWAVYAAKSMSGDGYMLTRTQKKILDILKETDGIEPRSLADRLGLNSKELQREIATLRHMEKVRASMKGEKRVICLW